MHPLTETRDLAAEDKKRCSKCNEVKSLDDFAKRSGRWVGVRSQCKACQKEYRVSRKEYHRDYSAQRNYGITPEQYADLLFLQGGVCAICETIAKPGKRLWIDHDHGTGAVRGLLCTACNTALGLLKESADLFQAAMEYLERA